MSRVLSIYKLWGLEWGQSHEHTTKWLDVHFNENEHVVRIVWVRCTRRGEFRKFMLKQEQKHKLVIMESVVDGRMREICRANGYHTTQRDNLWASWYKDCRITQ